MTVEEIISQISARMVKGIMFHIQMADYYNFLGLKGYSKCHEYHFLEENCNYRKLCSYYIEHFNKLIPDYSVSNPNVLPDSWFKYKRQDVDASTRQSSTQVGFDLWISWELNTKTLYQKMHNELIVLNEIALAEEIKKYILDVDEELASAQYDLLENKAISFDMSDIVAEQDKILKKYKKKIKELKLC